MPSQSGFIQADSCIAQILSIIHKMQTPFDNNPTIDVRCVFLDIFKAFDNVCHDGLIFILKYYGAECELLSLLKIYLQNREQLAVLNGQTSCWRKLSSEVRQESVLGSFLFLNFLNDLPDGITLMCKMFADDTSLFSKVLDLGKCVTKLNTDTDKR